MKKTPKTIHRDAPWANGLSVATLNRLRAAGYLTRESILQLAATGLLENRLMKCEGINRVRVAEVVAWVKAQEEKPV
jgi:hypothetical protein